MQKTLEVSERAVLDSKRDSARGFVFAAAGNLKSIKKRSRWNQPHEPSNLA